MNRIAGPTPVIANPKRVFNFLSNNEAVIARDCLDTPRNDIRFDKAERGYSSSFFFRSSMCSVISAASAGSVPLAK